MIKMPTTWDQWRDEHIIPHVCEEWQEKLENASFIDAWDMAEEDGRVPTYQLFYDVGNDLRVPIMEAFLREKYPELLPGFKSYVDSVQNKSKFDSMYEMQHFAHKLIDIKGNSEAIRIIHALCPVSPKLEIDISNLLKILCDHLTPDMFIWE